MQLCSPDRYWFNSKDGIVSVGQRGNAVKIKMTWDCTVSVTKILCNSVRITVLDKVLQSSAMYANAVACLAVMTQFDCSYV